MLNSQTYEKTEILPLPHRPASARVRPGRRRHPTSSSRPRKNARVSSTTRGINLKGSFAGTSSATRGSKLRTSATSHTLADGWLRFFWPGRFTCMRGRRHRTSSRWGRLRVPALASAARACELCLAPWPMGVRRRVRPGCHAWPMARHASDELNRKTRVLWTFFGKYDVTDAGLKFDL